MLSKKLFCAFTIYNCAFLFINDYFKDGDFVFLSIWIWRWWGHRPLLLVDRPLEALLLTLMAAMSLLLEPVLLPLEAVDYLLKLRHLYHGVGVQHHAAGIGVQRHAAGVCVQEHAAGACVQDHAAGGGFKDNAAVPTRCLPTKKDGFPKKSVDFGVTRMTFLGIVNTNK